MKIVRNIETWGTVIVIEASSKTSPSNAMSEVLDEAEEFLYQVDQEFSTFRNDSQVSRLRKGEINLEECSDFVKEVLSLCEYARELTLGAFDPWAVKDGFDPSGIVKGWASEVVANKLVSHGWEHVLVNAAGDIVVKGGREVKEGRILPYNIGISDPYDTSKIVKIFDVEAGSIATSGDYAKGAHIHDPHTGLIAIGAKSATVIGPDGAICDALATALMVDGTDSKSWIGREELSEYSYYVINRNENTSWAYGKNSVYLLGQPILNGNL